jgi:ubiquinone/menaquinone biosynthesis C-methylase UbiE
MGIYRRFVFPALCDFSLSRPLVARYRRDLLAKAGGEVLEVGLGTGLNLPHYPEQVRRITAVEPNPGMQRRARRRAAAARVEVDVRPCRGEQLPFPDACFDCVVSTFTLCSIDDVGGALAEVYRVLRPGGRFLFLEHGLSPDPAVRKWQRRLNWLERWLADGCRLDRDIKGLVASQPFRQMEVGEHDLEGTPRTHGHLYQGVATR